MIVSLLTLKHAAWDVELTGAIPSPPAIKVDRLQRFYILRM
jgi:hypothetical protein